MVAGQENITTAKSNQIMATTLALIHSQCLLFIVQERTV
jgi:hypothetical protein